MPPTFDGRALHRHRTRAGWSRRELGRIAQVSHETIRNAELGQSAPYAHTIKALADALDIAVDDLYDDNGAAVAS